MHCAILYDMCSLQHRHCLDNNAQMHVIHYRPRTYGDTSSNHTNHSGVSVVVVATEAHCALAAVKHGHTAASNVALSALHDADSLYEGVESASLQSLTSLGRRLQRSLRTVSRRRLVRDCHCNDGIIVLR